MVEIQTDKSEHAMVLTTTLNRLHKAGACRERYAHLLAALGGPSVDHDAPINLLTILEHNGLEDALWALQATEKNCDRITRLFGCECAEAVLPIYEREYPADARPRNAIDTARRFALGAATPQELDAARAAAWDAARGARAAAWDAARAATWAAARGARAAAWDAARGARAAAWDAARGARDAARDAQHDILVRYLLP
jgi:hypothetical protein